MALVCVDRALLCLSWAVRVEECFNRDSNGECEYGGVWQLTDCKAN